MSDDGYEMGESLEMADGEIAGLRDRLDQLETALKEAAKELVEAAEQTEYHEERIEGEWGSEREAGWGTRPGADALREAARAAAAASSSEPERGLPTVEFDPEADALYIKLREGERVEGVREVDTTLLLDVDADGNTLGVEVLTTKVPAPVPEGGPDT